MAGLMEENAINPGDVDDATKKGSGGDSSDTENVSAKGQLIKSLNITNAENLEARVRKELEEQGILDPNDDAKEADHDEILEELTRCQNELKALSNHNLSQLVSVFTVLKLWKFTLTLFWQKYREINGFIAKEIAKQLT